MATMLRPAAPPVPALSARTLARLDALLNRIYGSRYNPVYQSGAITVGLLAVLLATGLYLLLFYRVGTPYTSVVNITDQVWLGRWIRGVHRIAADAALVSAAVHAFRMFAQRRTWGRRTLPWITGLALVAMILVCGWTGYVMIWDVFGQALAIEGARVLDLVPLFAEPLGRAFTGEQPLPSAFFFLNLFLHIALPIGLFVLVLIHVSRTARPALLPTVRARWAGAIALVIGALLFPVAMAPAADALRRPATTPVDVLYGGWLALSRGEPALYVALGAIVLTFPFLLVPRFTRPRESDRPAPSVVNERLCTGCEQCALDCPWEAITMVPRSDGRATLLAHVEHDRCVSCGICAGSCAPMGIGPAGRTGRDQLTDARAFMAAHEQAGSDVVVVACRRGAGGVGTMGDLDGAPVLGVDCVGTVHSSVIESLLRGGASGVLVLACPVEDCWNREGTRRLTQRLYEGREAELHERVDRRRFAVANLTYADRAAASAALRELRQRTPPEASEPAPADTKVAS